MTVRNYPKIGYMRVCHQSSTSTAFDKARKLCLKLSHYSIKGKCLGWIKAFLSSRTQEVILNGKSSEKSNVTSGVPQGTVLGPLLFLVYINDMPSVILSFLRLFADDAYLYCIINSMRDAFILQEDLNSLQIDLNSLQVWDNNNSMEFHSLKCKVLTITNNILVTSDWSWNSSPSEMIGALGWNSLELLRKQSSLVMLHKIVNGQIASAQDLLPKFSRGSSSNFQQVFALKTREILGKYDLL